MLQRLPHVLLKVNTMPCEYESVQVPSGALPSSLPPEWVFSPSQSDAPVKFDNHTDMKGSCSGQLQWDMNTGKTDVATLSGSNVRTPFVSQGLFENQKPFCTDGGGAVGDYSRICPKCGATDSMCVGSLQIDTNNEIYSCCGWVVPPFYPGPEFQQCHPYDASHLDADPNIRDPDLDWGDKADVTTYDSPPKDVQNACDPNHAFFAMVKLKETSTGCTGQTALNPAYGPDYEGVPQNMSSWFPASYVSATPDQVKSKKIPVYCGAAAMQGSSVPPQELPWTDCYKPGAYMQFGFDDQGKLVGKCAVPKGPAPSLPPVSRSPPPKLGWLLWAGIGGLALVLVVSIVIGVVSTKPKSAEY